MEQEAIHGLQIPLEKYQVRAEKATGVSCGTIQKKKKKNWEGRKM